MATNEFYNSGIHYSSTTCSTSLRSCDCSFREDLEAEAPALSVAVRQEFDNHKYKGKAKKATRYKAPDVGALAPRSLLNAAVNYHRQHQQAADV